VKIIRVIARLNVGGPARHVVWLTREMSAAGHSSLLVAGSVPPGESDMAYFAAANGVEPITIPEMSRELSLRDGAVVWKLLRLFWREQPDVIHTHTAKAGAVGRLAALLYRAARRLSFGVRRPRPVVVHTYHGHVFHSYYGRLKTAVFLLIERALARWATDRIVVISDQQRDEINGRFGVGRRSQFVVVPLGLDLSAFEGWANRREEARRALNVVPDEIAVGIVGRLTEIKNHGLFVRAAASLVLRRQRSAGPSVRFVIAGDGHLRPQLEHLARSLGVGDRVLFMGHRDDMEAVYPAFDIVVLSSLNEGTPLTLVEAMANGCPIVSTAVGGVVDLMGPAVFDRTTAPSGTSRHEHGVLVHRHDPDTLATAIDYLIDRPAERVAMGERGGAFVGSSYELHRLIDDITALYAELTHSHAGSTSQVGANAWETRDTYSHSGERA
jgi:glycosyltransferase involved in cell wall biosynthesis